MSKVNCYELAICLIVIYLKQNMVFGVINVTSNEQYACVLRSEEYVDYRSNIGIEPSLFIGLMHISVVSIVPFIIETTLWHSVGFAVNSSINGPAKQGQLPPESSLILPLLTLSSTNAATSSANSPIIGIWTVSESFIKNMRDGMLFCQIQTETSSGNLRGHIFPRRDVLVAFLGDSAENGMGIFKANRIKGSTNNLVYLDYWILSKISSNDTIFQGIQAGSTYLPVAVFISNEGQGGVVENTIPVKLWISTPENGPSIQENIVFTGYPLVGPGSSNLILSSIDFDIISRFTQFYRLADYRDILVFNSNVSNSVYTPIEFTQSSLFYYMIFGAVFLSIIITYIISKALK
jgi:hypothetical protein